MVDQQRLLRCLSPGSIAVVGGEEAAKVIHQCLKLGFNGNIWPINPGRQTIEGIPCFRSVEDLPNAPDAAFAAIPADSSIEVIHKLNAMGAGGAVCYASGFREVGSDGHARHEMLLKAAADMPVLGPNCHGFLNTLCGAALWPDQHGLGRNQSGVAIISSSGNVAINFTLQQRGLPIAWLVTVGNQAVVGIEQCIAAALENDSITAIGLHIEGLKDLPLFIELADKARTKRIPVVALKTGKSDIGARITLSHTATLAGQNQLYCALFERLGIAQVATPEEFLEALKLATVIGPLPGKRIASMSCSGGEASLMADLSADREVEFPKLHRSHAALVRHTLNEFVNIDNPLDYHTFIWGDARRMTATFSAMMASGFDLTLLLLDFPYVNGCDPTDWHETLQALIAASHQTGCKAAVVSSMTENMTDAARQHMIENGIAPLQGMDQALAAIAAVSKIGRAWAEWNLPCIELPSPGDDPEEVCGHIHGMDEYQAKRMLKQSGVSVPQSILVTGAAAACDAASEIGYPVVLKAVGSGIAHKSEINAVVVGINSAPRLQSQVGRLLSIADTLIVEQMVQGVVAELLVGVSYDAQFGHYLILGFGGTLVELIGDREILLLPVSREDIIRSLEKLKTWPLLNAFRGRASADLEAIVQTVLAVLQLVAENRESIVELEINPLLVKAEGQGAVVADALITMKH